MDQTEPIESLPEITEQKSWYQKRSEFGILGIAIFLALVIFGGALLAYNSTTKKPNDVKRDQDEKFIANGSIVYGYWKGQNSVISAVDLAVSESKILAVLPTNIKHVKVLSGNTFIYIGDTDQFDYGNKLMVHTIDPASDKQVFEVEDKFGIDDYVVSQNGLMVALWVVGKPAIGDRLSGNRSQVYSLNIQTGENNLIFDELSSSSNPIHYPVGITNNGEVYLDTFLPNSGAGWAYGMSVSDFKGSKKENIESMKNGTYSSQPVMSPDGKYLVFAGYDGTDGTVKVDTFRKALVNPNTVELISVTDKTRSRVTTNLNNILYPLVVWDYSTGDIIISATQSISGAIVSEQYSYNLPTQKMRKIKKSTGDASFLGYLQNDIQLEGQTFPGDSGVGNLGRYYSNSINKLIIADPASNTTNSIPLDQLPVQLIAIMPSQFFPAIFNDKKLLSEQITQQLRLKTFVLKPSLVPVREGRQSTPKIPKDSPPDAILPLCRTITYPQCNALLGVNYPLEQDLSTINDPAFQECFWAQTAAAQAKNICMGSPLYLYGKKGTRVKVTIGTEVVGPNVTVSNSTIDTLLDGEDNIAVGGKSVPSITFDYVSKLKKIIPPPYGYIVHISQLESKLKEISTRFNFNKRETDDFIAFGRTINSTYVFVSFFDNETSHFMLPLYFDPVPDVYRNIVFYFEKKQSLPSQLPKSPVIESIIRTGLTAIEISYLAR